MPHPPTAAAPPAQPMHIHDGRLNHGLPPPGNGQGSAEGPLRAPLAEPPATPRIAGPGANAAPAADGQAPRGPQDRQAPAAPGSAPQASALRGAARDLDPARPGGAAIGTPDAHPGGGTPDNGERGCGQPAGGRTPGHAPPGPFPAGTFPAGASTAGSPLAGSSMAGYAPAGRPVTGRPLAGLTILVVEDSRYASEAVRLLCLRSGARIRRAATLASARRHLSLYRPTVLIVDLGLPDGSGCELIAEAGSGPGAISVILAMSGDPSRRGEAAAAGAAGFLEKPLISLAYFQEAVLALLPSGARHGEAASLALAAPPCPAALEPDPVMLNEDLAQISEILDGSMDEHGLGYAVQFAAGIGLQSGDTALMSAADRLQMSWRSGLPWGAELAELAGLVQQRLRERRRQ